LVESGPLAIRAVLSEAGDAREHDPAVYFAQYFVVDAEPVFHVRPVVLDDDVRSLDETEKDLAALRCLEVERNRALVAMQVLEIRPVARAAHVLVARRLDLDHVGAEIRELAHAARTGPHSRQVEHPKAGEGGRSFDGGHAGILLGLREALANEANVGSQV